MAVLNDIVMLARAGFTRDQITELIKADAGTQTEQTAPEVKQPEQPAPEVKPPEQPAVQAPDNTAQILAAISGLQSAIQAGNIGNSQQPALPTVDDVMTAIILDKPTNQKE